MTPKKAKSIPPKDHSEALRKSFSIKNTLIAASIIDENINPFSSAKSPIMPFIGMPAAASFASVVPTPVYACFRIFTPQAANAGKRPITTAGA